MFDGKSSSIASKTFKKINKIVDSAKKNGLTDNLASVESFLRTNLKVLEFSDYDLLTPDELVFNIGDNLKKDKNSKLNTIGNSFSSKYSSNDTYFYHFST
jgi:hypothetical protein